MSEILTLASMSKMAQTEHKLLLKTISNLSPQQFIEPGVTGEWSAKDLLAHLTAWEQMFLSWYRAGLGGEIPHTPAEDLTWKWADVHLLNERIFQAHRAESSAEVLEKFEASYQETLHEIGGMQEADLHDSTRFEWMRGGRLAGYIKANTYNHYKWANTLIKRKYPTPK
jgi:hypothetical protein